MTPRCFIFGGKAAPGYHMAKLIIRLINGVAEVVNDDPAVGGRLKVVFFPNFNVKNAHLIYPAADLSEQISTAGKEASGTGNMKFMLNGALTIGTLDGANVEIREEVGAENFFLFGLTADEVERRQARGLPARATPAERQRRAARSAGPDRRRQLLARRPTRRSGRSSRTCCSRILSWCSPTMPTTWPARSACSAAWNDPERWTRMSILNTARAGKFSSDRAIREYCDAIWNVRRTPTTFTP